MDSTWLFSDRKHLNKFMNFLINDIKALERMLAENLFETDVQRIGAEQELSLVDRFWRPAPINMEILDEIGDDHFTTEHSKYNLEINLDPLEFSGDCFSKMQSQLDDSLYKLVKVTQKKDVNPILVGILPTVRRSDLELNNLTDLRRYHLMNKAMNKLRGEAYEFRIQGVDELITKHNSIMFEGCNTSFQVHLQVSPDDFVKLYNWALAISGPVLAAATNSPILLGQRLWQETRIALFQQSVDTRRTSDDLREKSSRITFGNGWVQKSIVEIFRGDIANYRVLISKEIQQDSLEALEKGKIPSLDALQLHNGTVYKWNRACYGITNGKPHLRIENRILPSGPTTTDEIANAAFWVGLMKGIPQEYEDITKFLDFHHTRMNFLKAARNGLETQFKWVGNQVIPADEFILNELLPVAENGLKQAKIIDDDIKQYLGIIEDRVKSHRTGSNWILNSYEKLRKQNAKYEACVAITAGIVSRQNDGRPVHQWELAEIEEAGDWMNRYWKVEQIMSTDFFTVRQDDLIFFVANVMNWCRLRFIPVEDDNGNLAGLLTSTGLLEYFSGNSGPNSNAQLVKEIMVKDPLTVTPDTHSLDALTLMRQARVGCLPVVKKNKLVGMITEMSFMSLSEESIQELRLKSLIQSPEKT